MRTMKGIMQSILVICVLLYAGCGTQVKGPAAEKIGQSIEPAKEPAIDVSEEIHRTREDMRVQMEALFPDGESFPGWQRRNGISLFDETDLFEHINGAAEAFFAYGFQLCGTAEYIPAVDGGAASAEDEFILVDIYDMGIPIQAFGMYASEYYPESQPVDVGTQGYVEPSILNFWKGPYYVKIAAVAPEERSAEANMRLAKHIARGIPWKAEKPSMLSLLPLQGLVTGTERYILKNILGYGFLENGVTANYQVGGEESSLFIIQCESGDDARVMLTRFADYEEKSGEGLARIADLGEEGFTVNDRYYKRLIVVRQGRYVLIALKVTDEPAARELLRKAMNTISS